MRWRFPAGVCAAAALFLFGASQAFAGYAIQPAAGTQTTLAPTFLVHLDSGDASPQVHVGATATVDGNGVSPDEVGACSPSTPSPDPGAYTCAPTVYSTTGTSSLAAGSYYWWLTFTSTDPGASAPTLHVSGPIAFTAVAPPPPPAVTLTSPADGATVTTTPRLAVTLPTASNATTYVSTSSARSPDGAPAAGEVWSCSGAIADAGTYDCDVKASAGLTPGTTYYWWVVVTVATGTFTYGPRSFVVAAQGGGGGTPPLHELRDSPFLPSSAHYTGQSIKQTKLSTAAYRLSKVIGAPKSIAVACWSSADWANITGENPESQYSLLGFWAPQLPHWLELSPGICRTMETLVYHRPRYANRFTANAVDTLTHEMIHALGVHGEAQTECLAMQLSWITARSLGVPLQYSFTLSHLTLENYPLHPPRYVNRSACREDGRWDLFKGRPSLPWHQIQL